MSNLIHQLMQLRASGGYIYKSQLMTDKSAIFSLSDSFGAEVLRKTVKCALDFHEMRTIFASVVQDKLVAVVHADTELAILHDTMKQFDVYNDSGSELLHRDRLISVNSFAPNASVSNADFDQQLKLLTTITITLMGDVVLMY